MVEYAKFAARENEKLLCDVPSIDRMRVLRLMENLTLGTAAVGCWTESVHGAGSRQA